MKFGTGIVLCAVLLAAAGCASSTSPPPSAAEPALVSPADLLASLAEVANGRNADLAETGLVLKTIELKLLVGHERRSRARANFVIFDAEASRRSEVSFSQTFTLELPPPERRHTAAAAAVVVPGVVEFVDAAIGAARELAAAAAREGLPQKLREVELMARIVRSVRIEGGLGFMSLARPSVYAGTAGISDETNIVRLVFVSR